MNVREELSLEYDCLIEVMANMGQTIPQKVTGDTDVEHLLHTAYTFNAILERMRIINNELGEPNDEVDARLQKAVELKNTVLEPLRS